MKRSWSKTAIAILCAAAFAGPVHAAVLFIDASQGSDHNDGRTPATALATIQKGIDVAQNGDRVNVASGLYVQDVRFRGKNVILTSADPMSRDGPQRPAIRGTISFDGAEDASCTLTGFQINGSVVGFDAKIDPNGLRHTRATISHCTLTNILTGCGGVIHGCDGVIRNCLIADIGYMCDRAWPVPAIVGCHGLMENCTLANVNDGIAVLPGGTCTIRNCILYHCAPVHVPTGATVAISYCSVENSSNVIQGDGQVNWGPGNTDTAPCLVRVRDREAAGDYHLKSQAGRWDAASRRWVRDEVTSPCIDAGDPGSVWTAELWPHGKRINMGAYGGTAQASMSLSVFDSPADLDHDDDIDASDLLSLTDAWLTGFVPCAADLDRDGRVGLSDFVRIAGQWRTDVVSVGEPFELVLGKRASWSPGREGYDPHLPGYHIVGDIASITLQARTDGTPDRLVLAIETSPGMRPMLENFTVVHPHVRFSGEPFNPDSGGNCSRRLACSDVWEAASEIPADTYFEFEIVGDAVHVVFLPRAVELLRFPCVISWIDWYRR